jgi:hypothetical protein
MTRIVASGVWGIEWFRSRGLSNLAVADFPFSALARATHVPPSPGCARRFIGRGGLHSALDGTGFFSRGRVSLTRPPPLCRQSRRRLDLRSS